MHELEKAYLRLVANKKGNSSRETRLRIWSSFIRLRDLNKCLACGSPSLVAAHHIIRKTFMPQAQYLPGNGITLCNECHKHIHSGFNRKPNLSLPMDAQGGEKIEDITSLFRLLSEKSIDTDARYYKLSKYVLNRFKLFQGYDVNTHFPGNDIQQAYEIWRCSPKQIRDELLRANGITSNQLNPFGKGVSFIC